MKYDVNQSNSNAGYLASAGLTGIILLYGCGGTPEVKPDVFESFYATKQVRDAQKTGNTTAAGAALVNAELKRSKISNPTPADIVRTANSIANKFLKEAMGITAENDRKNKLSSSRSVLDYVLNERPDDASDADTDPQPAYIGDSTVLALERVAVYDTGADVDFERFKLAEPNVTLDTVVSLYSLAANAAGNNEDAKALLNTELVNFGNSLESYLTSGDTNQKASKRTAFNTLFGNVLTVIGSDADKLHEASVVWSPILEVSPTAKEYADTVAKN